MISTVTSPMFSALFESRNVLHWILHILLCFRSDILSEFYSSHIMSIWWKRLDYKVSARKIWNPSAAWNNIIGSSLSWPTYLGAKLWLALNVSSITNTLIFSKIGKLQMMKFSKGWFFSVLWWHKYDPISKIVFWRFLPLFDFFQQSGIVGADIGLGERVMPLWPLFID